MVDVIRKDYPAKTWIDKRGNEHYKPAHYFCDYVYRGREIAYYCSTDDVLYLNSECIDKNYKDKTFNRALNGSYSSAYKYLFELLKVDENTTISEFLNI